MYVSRTVYTRTARLFFCMAIGLGLLSVTQNATAAPPEELTEVSADLVQELELPANLQVYSCSEGWLAAENEETASEMQEVMIFANKCFKKHFNAIELATGHEVGERIVSIECILGLAINLPSRGFRRALDQRGAHLQKVAIVTGQ